MKVEKELDIDANSLRNFRIEEHIQAIWF